MAKDILSKAAKERISLGHPYVGTEHLMLALLSMERVEKLTKPFNLTYNIFKKAIIENIGTGSSTDKKNVNTPALNSVIKCVKKDDALLYFRAILDWGEGVALRVLLQMNINLEELYNVICSAIEHEEYTFLKKNDCLTDMNEEVRKDETVVTGFDKELTQLLKNLLRLKKPNTIIIGEPGVGKTALVEKLAVAVNNKEVPEFLQNLKIIQLSLGSAVAGTKYRGEFEEKINKIIREVEKYDEVVLFIDEIHMMVGAGGAEGAIDASNIFKPALARGKIKMIGATTKEEYDKFIATEKAFARRFNLLTILEATKEETINIMKEARPKLEKHYSIRISDKDIEAIYKDSTHKNGRMPDIALDSLEEWCVDKYFDKEKKKEKKEVTV